MIPRILSIASALWVYVSLAVLAYGLWNARRRFDRLALIPSLAGLAASAFFLQPVHRLFFDEDIYISIANNLAHAPVNQITVLGGPDDVQVTSYYKEPAGWPVLLSLVFLVTGRSETVAFWVTRVLFAMAIAAVYHLAREVLETRRQALAAAIVFGATPVCFWYSASVGTDVPAALLAALGMWGLVAENEALAAAGLALAAQTRMELLILVPLVWVSRKISIKWKLIAGGLVLIEIAHVAWVMSVAPLLAQAEHVGSTFSPAYLTQNLPANLRYIFNPLLFPALMTILALAALFITKRGRQISIQAFLVFGVYLLFYAGSFDTNPRYSIQMLAPIAVLSASLMRRPAALLLLAALALPYTHEYEVSSYARTLEADHRISVEFASRIKLEDLIVSGEPEIFLNQGRAAMNAVFASERREILEKEIRRRKVWYHAGVRTNVENSQEWTADRWVKSNFELHLIEAQEIRGERIAFYEILLKHFDREARLVGSFERKCNRSEGC